MTENEHEERNSRRALGVHLTSIDLFLQYIFPEIKYKLRNFIWVDLYSGEGNLILPILKYIPEDEKISFFENNIFLYDIQHEMVEKCIKNSLSYGIPQEIAKSNIIQRDNLDSFPKELKKKSLPIFHITNPPYLYLGYIRKHKETQRHFKYFENENEGLQDLYQIALMNDLRNKIENLIYIIPTNFLFGASVSNKFRMEFLPYYDIKKSYIFEIKVFDYTGTNICIVFFKRKEKPKSEIIRFRGIKLKNNNKILERNYILKPNLKYRAGGEFDEFNEKYKSLKPLKVKYYLLNNEVKENFGVYTIKVIDTNEYLSNEYKRIKLQVSKKLKDKVLSNILYVRTVDTGKHEGRAGLNEIKRDFDVDGIYVSKATYRTSPIQIFFGPQISSNDQILLMEYFNLMLEHFRKELDSEFLTTYKYSNAHYTRKYLGLSQVRSLIETFPILSLDSNRRNKLKLYIENNKINEILNLFDNLKQTHRNKKKIDLTSWL